jgi:hypothetical protein
VVLRTGFKAVSELGEQGKMIFFNEETCENINGAKEKDLEVLHRVLFMGELEQPYIEKEIFYILKGLISGRSL